MNRIICRTRVGGFGALIGSRRCSFALRDSDRFQQSNRVVFCPRRRKNKLHPLRVHEAVLGRVLARVPDVVPDAQQKIDLEQVQMKQVHTISKYYARKLRDNGVETLAQLLWKMPRDYVSYLDVEDLKDIPVNSLVIVNGRVRRSSSFTASNNSRLGVVKVEVVAKYHDAGFDDPDELVLDLPSFYRNIPASSLASLARKYQPGMKVSVRGRINATEEGRGSSVRAQMRDFTIQTEGEAGQEESSIFPVYSASMGLKPKDFEVMIPKAIAYLKSIRVVDPLPHSVLAQQRLMEISNALENIHMPRELQDATSAKKRLVFEEAFLLHAGLEIMRKPQSTQADLDLGSSGGSARSAGDSSAPALLELGVECLPFQLTGAQQRALREILQDIAEAEAGMKRLLQGDVGSGKTIIAFLAMLSIVDRGRQAALMAPTEVLAEQHAATFKAMLDTMARHHSSSNKIKIALLSGSTPKKAREQVSEGLLSGSVHIIIGTHSLINESLGFKDLGLAVIDEQHRFGVEQRAMLQYKSLDNVINLLAMSATPIPRSMALAFDGDMASSIVDEMPPGRPTITTKVINGSSQPDISKAYSKLRALINEDSVAQGYVIFPFITKSDYPTLTEVKALEEEFTAMTKTGGALSDLECALLHGGLNPNSKNEIIAQFAQGLTKVLMSTTVIEVGINVPNARVIIIEGAERFGLAQLHQLRGRIGRKSGGEECFCFLITTAGVSEASLDRLRILEESRDGFAIAEFDMILRGHGQLGGVEQSGHFDKMLQIGDFTREDERAIMADARRSAADIVAREPLDGDVIRRLVRTIRLRRQAGNVPKLIDI